MFLGGHVEIVIVEKLKKICLGFWGLWQKNLWVFIKLSKSLSVDWKPEHVLIFGLSGSNMAAVWPQGFSLWSGSEVIYWKGKASRKKANKLLYFYPMILLAVCESIFMADFFFLYVTASYHFITWVFKKGLFKFAFWTYTATLFIWATVTGLLINVNRLFSFYF